MAKASPMVRSFNAGEFSGLLEGRTDIDRYPASAQKMLNVIAAPQGPAICRSGTTFVAPAYSNSDYSALVAFIFSNEQAKLLEVSSDRIRFFDEDGLQVYAPEPVTVVSALGSPMRVETAGTPDALVGDQVVLGGFSAAVGLNGEAMSVVARVGNVLTLNATTVATGTGTVSRVYHVPVSYTDVQRRALRYVQSVDVVYFLSVDAQPMKLSRFGDYDWRIEPVKFIDGPYGIVNDTPTELRPSGTGNAIPDMTSNTAPSGEASGTTPRPAVNGTLEDPSPFLSGTRSITYNMQNTEWWHAFSPDDELYYASLVAQKGTIQYETTAGFVCDGYAVYVALDNQDTSYTAKDFAPSNWVFQGNLATPGSPWVTLDQQEDYVLYDGNKSVFFKIDNDVPYRAYRLRVNKLTRNGPIELRVRRLVIRSTASATIGLTASSVEGINGGQGFLATDVGRLIRVKGSDQTWRACRILSRSSTTQVQVKLEGEPLPNTKAITEWRLGYWSDTTGWPSCGDFFEDRLWLMSSAEAPDLVTGSRVGEYEDFAQTDPTGEVLDDSAIVVRLNSRKLSRVRWVSSDSRGLLLGTGSEEYALSAPNSEPMTARNFKARPATRRGSAEVEPVRVDNQVLFVQRSGRTLREFAFVFENDGYKSPSMSQLASHLGAIPFVEMDYAAEPHSLLWLRKADGSLVGMTYNRDEDVVGWHRHDLSGGSVEALAVTPQKDQLQDALWVVVSRQIDGQTRQYIERLMPFWDFGDTLATAHFLDSALRYQGPEVNTVFGLQHLEGREVYGLADGYEVGPFTVADGSVTLPLSASNILLGLGYESEVILPRLENGAADGTAMGKIKRINSLTAMLWSSCGGQIGVYNEQTNDIVYEDVEYPKDVDTLGPNVLYSGKTRPITPTAGYDMEGRVAFRRPASSPFPFNVVAIMPQLNTQDR